MCSLTSALRGFWKLLFQLQIRLKIPALFFFFEQLKAKFYGKKNLDFLSLGKKKAFSLLLSENLSYVVQRVLL